jgi:hypothetical protein
MAHNKFSRTLLSAVALAFGFAVIFPFPVLADDGSAADPAASSPVTGVYVKDAFTLPVVQQPASNMGYVSTDGDTVTQFDLATQYGNVGLLAHNYLAGNQFFNLSVGDVIYVFHGTESIETYVITEVLEYQALSPYSPYSDFVDLATGDTLTANDLFHRVYMGDRHLTLQTCIERDGESSWGRLFVIARPLADVQAEMAAQ